MTLIAVNAWLCDALRYFGSRVEEREETETKRQRLGTGATPVCSRAPHKAPHGPSLASLLVWFRLVLDRKQGAWWYWRVPSVISR